MGLFEWFGPGAGCARAGDGQAVAPGLPPPAFFFSGPALRLLSAARASDEAAMRQALADGANPNAQGPPSNRKATPQLTLLHYAVGVRDARGAALLVRHGADPLFEPRADDGPALLFPIIRQDPAMLDALLAVWPMERIPVPVQSMLASSTLPFHCQPCLAVMFRHGLSPGLLDSRKYNLFMEALSYEMLDIAEWLLVDIKVPLDTMTSGGVTPANMVQRALTERYRPGSPTHQQYLKFQAFMASQGVQFPVESSAEWRARMGVK